MLKVASSPTELLLTASLMLSASATVTDVAEVATTLLTGGGLGARQVGVVLSDDVTEPPEREVVSSRCATYVADRIEPGGAYACVPLIGDHGVVGALRIVWDRPRAVCAGERALIATLASYVARALERAERLQSRIRVAETLQRAMLTSLPVIEDYELAARYLPADIDQRVGGDWYDAVAGSGGRLSLVIGDVVGHDMAAAARMSQLRSMLRAYLVDRREPPSALLRRLDAANHALGESSIATAVVAVVDRSPDGRHRLRWSNAGHPPPVLIRRDGTVQPLTGHDMLIGARRFARRHTFTHPLPPGSTLLLHTDGLVETRDRAIDENLARFYRRLGEARRSGLDEMLRYAMGDPARERTDDVAVLGLRLPERRAGRLSVVAG